MILKDLIEKLQELENTYGANLPVKVSGSDDNIEVVGAFDEDGMDCEEYPELTATHIYLEG